jgi:very-short-patch-repair endonuclease
MARRERLRSVSPEIDRVAREMRRAPTAAEERLWSHLRNRQLAGAKFRRQHPFQRFVLDFYCPASRLVIEVDGDVHSDPDQAARDEERTRHLAVHGLRVIRFRNEEVLYDITTVLERIRRSLPSPAPWERGQASEERASQG